VVPARVDGLWCGGGALHGARLRVAQRHQLFEATLALGPAEQLLVGRIDAERLSAAGGFGAVLEDGRLRITQAGDAPTAVAGAALERCAG